MRSNTVVDTIQAPLDVGPKALCAVDVGLPLDVLLSSMIDSLMGIAELAQPIVALEFVGVDDGARGNGDVLLDDGDQGLGLHIGGNRQRSPFRFPLDRPNDDGLTSGSPATLARPLAADVGFVYLDATTKRAAILSHELADLAEHAESGSVIDPQLPLQLHGGYPSPSLGHQEDSVEPRAKRKFRLVEDGVSSGGYLAPAELTAIDFPASNAEMLRDSLAVLTRNPIGPTGLQEEVKAGVIRWELSVKDCLGVLSHCSLFISELDMRIAD